MTQSWSRSEGLPRRTLGAALVAAPLSVTANVASAASCPGGGGVAGPDQQAWSSYARPEDAGIDPAGIAAAEQALYEIPTTSLMIVRKGRVVYTYGDVAQPSYLASARKSLLSMLYGNYVEAGVINLDRTIGELGIEESGPFLDVERTARVRDLLTSSSGVYWPAGSPGGDEDTPARGSQKPGAHFHYNNWDFNVAGEVFQRLTGQTVFDAFERDLAVPLGMQDWDRSRQRMLGYANDPSRYKAYHFFLSARDMAKLGQLMLNKGVWQDRRLVPAKWVAESTTTRFPDADPKSGIGYAYLWWKPGEGRKGAAWADSYLANGHFGQFILCLPARDAVIVHRRAVPDELAIARNIGKTKANIPAVKVDQFLRIADRIIDSMA